MIAVLWLLGLIVATLYITDDGGIGGHAMTAVLWLLGLIVTTLHITDDAADAGIEEAMR